jgi:hypothetical protein
MRTRTGLAGIGIVLGCLFVAACGSEHPAGVRVDADQHYSVEELPDAEGYGGEATTQSDTTTQRGIGGFGSGN